VTVSHTAVATVAAVELAGATPVLVDIDPATYTMHPDALAKAITPRTRAVIAVHLYGQAVDLGAIMAICKPKGIRVVEDCAQCHGALLNGKRTGSMGDIAAFSFYPTKNLGAIGDGGAVATSDPDLARNCRLLREYGWARRYISDIAGFNTRLDELQSAVLRVKLAALDADNDRRRALADVYGAALAGVAGSAGVAGDAGSAGVASVTLPTERAGCRHVYHLYAVLVGARDRVLDGLKQRGVLAGIHYPVPIHMQPAYAGRVAAQGTLPVTERVAKHEISLPMYPELSHDDARRVAEALVQSL
jgi:dTDP-4-amino-4,6-dideoxygalactose transaminase